MAAKPLALNGVFWRKLARLGAAHFPEWWVRYSPPAFGLAAAIVVPSARKAVVENLRRIRGPARDDESAAPQGLREKVREALDTAETFVDYAGCLAEALSNGSKNERLAELETRGKEIFEAEIRRGKGIVMVTAHTAGWELAGPVLAKEHGLEIVMVMEAEKDREARELHDGARRASGMEVVHVGDDPLSSLPLLQRLRRGGVVAVQIDRVPSGMRARKVTLFGREGSVPEGPMRLAQLSGAPILPVFCARLGFRRYLVQAGPLIRVERRPSDAAIDEAAQRMADAMSAFLRAHPTQWFHFSSTNGEGK